MWVDSQGNVLGYPNEANFIIKKGPCTHRNVYRGGFAHVYMHSYLASKESTFLSNTWFSFQHQELGQLCIPKHPCCP